MYWQLNDVTLTPGAPPQKLLARFATDVMADGGIAEAKWEISNDNASGLGTGLSVSIPANIGSGADPFADEDGQQVGGGWKEVPGARRIVSGSYQAR